MNKKIMISWVNLIILLGTVLFAIPANAEKWFDPGIEYWSIDNAPPSGWKKLSKTKTFTVADESRGFDTLVDWANTLHKNVKFIYIFDKEFTKQKTGQTSMKVYYFDDEKTFNIADKKYPRNDP
jgi:hypothetical protein